MDRMFLGLFITLLVTACGGSSDSTGTVSANDPRFLPSLSASWQIQLKGSVNSSYTVDIYTVDLFDVSESEIAQLQAIGIKVICYFSAGSYEEWRVDANDFPSAVLGNTLAGWPGERWLDISSSEVMGIMQTRLNLAESKGCDGVDPDNMDGYSNNSGFALSGADQLAYNRFIADEAHARGLAVGLKNNLEQVGDLVDSFDFAINEQCFQLSECDLLEPFIMAEKPVFNIEYAQNFSDASALGSRLCLDSINRQFSTLILPINLDDSFRFSCL